MRPTAVLRILAAFAAVLAGYAHYTLAPDYSNDIGKILVIGGIKNQFWLNAIASIAIAVAVVVPHLVDAVPKVVARLGSLAGIGWAATSLLAFKLARTDTGWFSFQDAPGLNPSPEAAMAVYGEGAALLLLVVALVLDLRDRSAD